MGRIRTIKPEFWTDDLIGTLSRDARLLFIATWNLADDEGLLQWSAPFLKGAVFPFDDEVTVTSVADHMASIQDAGLVFAYLGGRSQQKLGCIINFHKHQKINRPSPSKLPPPSLQVCEVRQAYGHRDGMACHLCGKPIEAPACAQDDDFALSIDHVVPKSKGGTDYPSNLKAAHQTCNKGRRDRSVEEYRAVLLEGRSAAQARGREPQRHDTLSCSVSRSLSISGSASNQDRDRDRDREAASQQPGAAVQDASLTKADPQPSNELDRLLAACNAALGEQAITDPVIGPIALLIERGAKQAEVLTILRSEARRQRRDPIRTWHLWADKVSKQLANAPVPHLAKPKPADPPGDPRIELPGGVSALLSAMVKAFLDGKWPWERWGNKPGEAGCNIPLRHWHAFGVPLPQPSEAA